MMRRSWLWIAAAFLSAGSAQAVVGGGDITFEGGGAGKVLFSHERHVADIGLTCQQCHPKLYLDVGQHKPVTMKEMAKGKSCGACHDGKKAFSSQGDCKRCHSN